MFLLWSSLWLLKLPRAWWLPLKRLSWLPSALVCGSLSLPRKNIFRLQDNPFLQIMAHIFMCLSFTRHPYYMTAWNFRAEKRSAQASAHPLSQAQGGNFLCVDFACLLLEFWVKCTRCERFLPVKHFYLTCLLFFPSLENYFGFMIRTTNVKGKTYHYVSLRWNKRFWTFLKRRVFFLIVHPINLWVDFAGLN